MNNKNKIYLYTAFFLLGLFTMSPLFGQEQPGLRERANQLYLEYQYAKAVPIYLKLVDSKKPRLEDLERLAESYSKMNNYESAENWYARIVQDKNSQADNLLKYASVLKQNSRYSEAKKALQEYAEKTGEKEAVVNEIAGCDSALVWMANPTLHSLLNEEKVNTDRSEFSAFPIGGKVYYTGEPASTVSNDRYGWTGNSYLRVYTADINETNQLMNAGLSDASINNEEYHVGPVSTDKSGNTLYVTRTYIGKEGEITKERNRKYQTNRLELFIYNKNADGEWVYEPFQYNNVKKYSVGHATLSPDEKVLYFVSDMPGGLGGTDIWYSEKQANGTWGQPQNAGSGINTTKDELFPNSASDGTLYYSSNGLPGMGGLDVFSNKGSKNAWGKSVNLKYPINSAGDDFAFITNEITQDGMSGYLSSNRQGGKGDDDIYSFHYQQPKIILVLKGVAYDKDTREPLAETSITLFGEGKTTIAKKNNASDGSFIFEIDPGTNYMVLGQKTSYLSDSVAVISTKGIAKSDTLYASLYLEPILVVGKTFTLENIHYDFDKHNIRQDAADILNGLVKTMRENPTLKIELASHTDSRGADAYNMALSQRRAQSAVDYLVSQGINRDRMVAKGYGESRLLNNCSNGVKCSEADHQANRRTEFTVLSF